MNVINLKEGDRLLTPEGAVKIVTIKKDRYEEPVRMYNFHVEDWVSYFVSKHHIYVHNGKKHIRLNRLMADLKGYVTKKWNTGGTEIMLDKKGMKHILERHHPKYWNGTTKALQSFFRSKLKIGDIKNIAGNILKQNRGTIASKGSKGTYQVEGVVDGISYVLGLKRGRVGQLFPKK